MKGCNKKEKRVTCHEPANCSKFILLQYDDKFRSDKLLESKCFIFCQLWSMLFIDIVNMNNIKDKGRKYNNC